MCLVCCLLLLLFVVVACCLVLPLVDVIVSLLLVFVWYCYKCGVGVVVCGVLCCMLLHVVVAAWCLLFVGCCWLSSVVAVVCFLVVAAWWRNWCFLLIVDVCVCVFSCGVMLCSLSSFVCGAFRSLFAVC